MIYFVLDDHRIEIFVFLLLLLPFDIEKFYMDTFVSSDHPGAIRQWDARLFPENRFFGCVYDFRVDHDSGSEKFIFFRFFFSLAGSDNSDILSYLWSGESDSFVFIHRY